MVVAWPTDCSQVVCAAESIQMARTGHGQHEIPWLAGQVYPYMVGQSTGWSKQRGQGTTVDTSAIMAPTAHNLTHSQIEAVAAYVSIPPFVGDPACARASWAI